MSRTATVSTLVLGLAAVLLLPPPAAEAEICNSKAKIAAARAGKLKCEIPTDSQGQATPKKVDATKQCKLDDVELKWITDNNDLREAAGYLAKIIEGLGKEEDKSWPQSGSYAQDQFGKGEVAVSNRDLARRKFAKAQTDLKELVRLISGSANENCQKCFALNDWYVLRSAARFIYRTKHITDAELRVGAGALQEPPSDDLTVAISNADGTISIGNDATHEMLSAGLIRSQVDLMVGELCEGHDALQSGDAKKRSAAARNIQEAFDLLADTEASWKPGVTAGAARMTALQSEMNTNCNSPEFYGGDLSHDTLCKLAKKLK